MNSKKSTSILLYIALTTAIAATLASIYFIEVKHNPAATLCWFDRMLMFGLVIILTVGLLKRDPIMKYYGYAFLLFGIPSALYQQLVHWDILSLTAQTCSVSYVCTTKFFELFGFITQVTLCLGAFLIIWLCLKFGKIQ